MAPHHLYLSDTEVHPRVTVRPLVLCSIVDHYSRREEAQQRVIGTLLGTIKDGVVDVTNCFPVPHNETAEQVAMNMEFQRTMFDLHQKVNPKEVVVGWYATGLDITEYSVLIHEFYGRETENPVHLTLECNIASEDWGFQAYVSSPLGVATQSPGTVFVPIQAELKYSDAEGTGMELIQATHQAANRTVPVMTELERLEAAVTKLAENLGIARDYVQNVIDGAVEGDKSVGRMLLGLVQSVPSIDSDTLDKLLNNTLQDLLLVVYLSNLTRAQVHLSEQIYNLL